MLQGWIKLHRKINESEVWTSTTPEQKTIFVTLLLMANHQQNSWEWQGQVFNLQPGQTITSIDSIVKAAGKGITTQKVRTALKKFEKYGILTDKSTKQGRLITLVNWGHYQQGEEKLTKEPTDNQQTANRQLTANKNVKREEGNNSKGDPINKLSFNAAKDQLNIPEEDLLMVNYFMQKHKHQMNEEHKQLKVKAWEEQIKKMRTVDLRSYELEQFVDDLADEEMYKLIDAYFQTDYGDNCDYSIYFFNSNDVKAPLYEGCFNEEELFMELMAKVAKKKEAV